jgi:Tat protein secretion system quality control protein TatD with DNase activity
VRLVAEKVAACRQMSLEELEKLTDENFAALFLSPKP